MQQDQVLQTLQTRFNLRGFRPGQDQICRELIAGRDLVVVMPTGAGKSLCYQLPALVRKGTCLVISPLIALIEDQVESLRSRGLKAERIHSARTRESAQEVCKSFLRQEIEFLFIAPERLSVPGFCELLGRGQISLIAIDEAHCISHWGHDFRPDYRLLGSKLSQFTQIPKIALTATATPKVQEDIARQLQLKNEKRLVQGFRRTNIGIGIEETAASERQRRALTILQNTNELLPIPAIIYAPTRKATEEMAAFLKSHFTVEAYHAGLPTQERERVQERFIKSELQVIVATIAFGMGIDKPNIRTVIHLGLPGSLESYYQEIGRAGRDGQASKAYLLFSYADQKTHEFFLDLNYPDPQILRQIFKASTQEPQETSDLMLNLKKILPHDFERACEQLQIHGGLKRAEERMICRGEKSWESSYLTQREHKVQQLKKMWLFTQNSSCRMLQFIRHFGDQNDQQIPCGLCDICEPESFQANRPQRQLTGLEQKACLKIQSLLGASRDRDSVAAGTLFMALTSEGLLLQRPEFERLISELERRKYLNIQQASFEKNGEEISFRKLIWKDPRQKLSPIEISEWTVPIVQKSKKSKKSPPTARRKNFLRKKTLIKRV